MSAIADGDNSVIQVLYALHAGFDTMDFAGPMEVLSYAQHDIKNKGQ